MSDLIKHDEIMARMPKTFEEFKDIRSKRHECTFACATELLLAAMEQILSDTRGGVEDIIVTSFNSARTFDRCPWCGETKGDSNDLHSTKCAKADCPANMARDAIGKAYGAIQCNGNPTKEQPDAVDN